MVGIFARSDKPAHGRGTTARDRGELHIRDGHGAGATSTSRSRDCRPRAQPARGQFLYPHFAPGDRSGLGWETPHAAAWQCSSRARARSVIRSAMTLNVSPTSSPTWRTRTKLRNTIRAYRGDLIGFAAHHDGDLAALTTVPVRAFLGEIAGQAPASHKRKRAAVASFCKWAVRHELLDASPMDRIDTIEVQDAAQARSRRRRRSRAGGDLLPTAAQGRAARRNAGPGAVRDRLHLRRPRLGGLRAARRGLGPAPGRRACPPPRQGRHRPHHAAQRPWLRRAAPALPGPGPGTPPARCPASTNGRGGPLSYDGAHSRWKKYCAAVGTRIGIRQLRHAHATELINSDVSIEVVRRRLGHASAETTQVYTLLADTARWRLGAECVYLPDA